MHSIIRTDIIDILKVSGVSFGTVGLTQTEFIHMNEVVQQTGNSILILLAVGYGVVKFVKIFREMKWQKEDRLNE